MFRFEPDGLPVHLDTTKTPQICFSRVENLGVRTIPQAGLVTGGVLEERVGLVCKRSRDRKCGLGLLRKNGQ